MAEHGGTMDIGTATGNDYNEHERTYHFFVGLAKWGTLAVLVILILMAFFLL